MYFLIFFKFNDGFLFFGTNHTLIHFYLHKNLHITISPRCFVNAIMPLKLFLNIWKQIFNNSNFLPALAVFKWKFHICVFQTNFWRVYLLLNLMWSSFYWCFSSNALIADRTWIIISSIYLCNLYFERRA